MKERGYYTIELPDGGKIGLRFSTWTFKRFSEITGDLPLATMLNKMYELTISDIINLVLCAAECYSKEKKQKFEYNDFDAANWIDKMGGLAGEVFIEMLSTIKESFIDSSMEGENHREVDSPDNKSNNVAPVDAVL